MERKLRVLVIAEAANPEWVSVPLIGWSLATHLAKVADVHIVTQIRNREAFLRAGLIEGQDFTAIDSEAFAGPLWRLGAKLRMGEGKGWTMMQAISALSYPYFECLVWRKFGKKIADREYDIVHRITPLSPTISSPIAKKCAHAGVPFVVGPLNGGVPWPKGFDAERRREREWLSYLRNAYKLQPGRHRSLKNTAAILTGSGHTQGEIPTVHKSKTFHLPENAIDPTRFSKTKSVQNTPLRACFIGRLVPYKGADMLIEAAKPFLQSGQLSLSIIGDGPMMESLKTQAADLADSVQFHGWLAHEDVQNVMSSCDFLAFPSIREFGGGVVLEAMALSLPALVVDYAGPGELVNDANGWKVPIGNRDEIVSAFRIQLEKLIAEPDTIAIKGQAGFKNVTKNFTWDAKAKQILKVYSWVVNGGDKPSLFD